ncbi:hypothetical protein LEP1GSC052_2632 [Leptospira kmetyi serovar Malaysia str. Bejo-Iso9]|nr:hypothetical protein LEP1GSC052_2632 [Leptospira kmetyi serovar Malaysia str. Bejo-Iso9]
MTGFDRCYFRSVQIESVAEFFWKYTGDGIAFKILNLLFG